MFIVNYSIIIVTLLAVVLAIGAYIFFHGVIRYIILVILAILVLFSILFIVGTSVHSIKSIVNSKKRSSDYYDTSNAGIFDAKNKNIKFIHKIFPETNNSMITIKSSDPVIKVATFNIEWGLLDENGKNSSNIKSNDSDNGCKEIFRYFVKQKCDFICLQESRYDFRNEIAKNYTIISHTKKIEKQFTFIDTKKYIIKTTIMGEISPGRPFTLCLLESKRDILPYTLINIHCPHGGDINHMLKTIRKKIIKNNLVQQVSGSRIILAGDFNRNFQHSVSFDLGNTTTTLYKHDHSINTCCDTGSFRMKKVNSAYHKFDHVLDSYGLQYKIDYPTITQVFKSANASDHEPVIATLLIGYPSTG